MLQRFWTLVALLTLTACMNGCGGASDADPSLVPAKGVVTSGGSPLSGGSIIFTDGTNSYSALIGSDGSYEIKASPSASGARPGTYKVGITSNSSEATMDADGNPVEAKSAVDSKYNSPETSGLSVDVKDGGGPYDFDLK